MSAELSTVASPLCISSKPALPEDKIVFTSMQAKV